MSSFQHSPVPGNPTPPLTPNGPGAFPLQMEQILNTFYVWCDGRANLKSYLNCSLLASSSYYQTKVKKLHHNTTPPTPANASPPQILNLTSTDFLFVCLLLLSSTQATASRPRSPLPQVTTVLRATTAPPAPAALRTPNQTSP